MTSGLAMTRTLLLRHRFGFPAALSFMGITALVFLLLKKEQIGDFPAFLFFTGLMVSGFYLLTVFIHADSDLATAGSTYPSHYFTLPVKTSELVAWPVGLGTILVGISAWVVASAISASGYKIDPVASSLGWLCLLTTLQAIFWYPFGIPYSKLVLTVIAVIGIFTISMALETYRVHTFLGVILFSMFVTGVGVAKARAGKYFGGSFSRAPSVAKPSEPVKELPAFKNTFQAQSWYEWRQQGKTFPILVAITMGLFWICYTQNDTVSPLRLLQENWLKPAPTVPTMLMSFLPVMICLMPLYTWALGCGAKRTDVKAGERTFHLFYGTRPVTDENLVGSKLKLALTTTLVGWGILLVTCLPFLFATSGEQAAGTPSSIEGPLFSIMAPYMTGEVTLRVVCVLAVLVFFTWRNYAIGLWTELHGGLSFRYLQPMVSVLLYVFATGNQIKFGTWKDFTFVPICLALLLTIKLTLAIYLAKRNLAKGFMSVTAVRRVFGGYALGVLVLGTAAFIVCGTVRTLLENNQNIANIFFPSLGLVVCLYVPVARILGAVTALSATRHR